MRDASPPIDTILIGYLGAFRRAHPYTPAPDLKKERGWYVFRRNGRVEHRIRAAKLIEFTCNLALIETDELGPRPVVGNSLASPSGKP